MVDASSRLRQLASGGFDAVPPTDVANLALWCRDYCDETSDARFCSIGDALQSFDDWWREHEKLGGIPSEVLDELDAFITQRLTTVLDTDDLDHGARLARDFRDQLRWKLTRPQDWRNRGLVRPFGDSDLT